MSLSLPINGSKKRPTCTVPAEHSQARQAADESFEKKNTKVLDSLITDETFKEKKNLPLREFLQFPLAFLNVLNHSAELHPMAMVYDLVCVYNEHVNPKM